MRHPSPQLAALLEQLDLCPARDLRLCHSLVRRLARDLPAFDSVWVDALVQRRRLTPFQARWLLSDEPGRLNAGPCVLIDQLGHQYCGHTYLARRRHSRERCVVRFVDVPADQTETVLGRLHDLAAAFKQFQHSVIVGPHASLLHEGRPVAVSRFAPGGNLLDTLVQIGRFPARDVDEIGRQLLEGMAAAESIVPAHGDIRVANLLLTSSGRCSLVNAGVVPASGRRFIVHHDLRPDRCDTVAPELIAADRAADARSDLYATGCILWQLLCGRPAYPFSDPLEKLAAHQTRDIADVREIAPETPAWLAEAIEWMTRRDPAARPQSFAEVSREWNRRRAGRAGGLAHARLSPRVREMTRRSEAPHPARGPLTAAIVLLCGVAAGAALLEFAPPSRLPWLAWTGAAAREEPSVKSETPVQPGLPEIPEPDARGVIELTTPGPWRPRDLSVAGPLTLRGPVGKTAVVVVSGEPMAIRAETVRFENVRFVQRDAMPEAMLTVNSRNMRLNQCYLVSRHDGDRVPAIAWTPLDARDRSGRQITVTDTVISGFASAFLCRETPAELNLGNTLVADCLSALVCEQPVRAGQDVMVRFVSATVRRAATAIRVRLPAEVAAAGHVSVLVADSVFALEGTGPAIATLEGPGSQTIDRPIVEIMGPRDSDGSLVSPGALGVAWFDLETGRTGPAPSQLAFTDDVVASPLTFAGPAGSDPTTSRLTGFEAPRLSAVIPGIEPSKLPAAQSATTAHSQAAPRTALGVSPASGE